MARSKGIVRTTMKGHEMTVEFIKDGTVYHTETMTTSAYYKHERCTIMNREDFDRYMQLESMEESNNGKKQK